MPELPEVETVRRGITPHIEGRTLSAVVVREPRLRWPIDPELAGKVAGLAVRHVSRRAKYVLIDLGAGLLILHLGMSGSLRFVPAGTAPEKHDHVDLIFGDTVLRYRDPRRFGAILWHPGPVETHPLLKDLGPEPLSPAFDGEHFFRATRGKTQATKLALMDNHVVVGVGNIYANESLFEAGLLPTRPAGQLDRTDCARLAECVKAVLARAIEAGGSTLRDFVDAVGKPGYFQQSYFVYGRDGLPCHACGTAIERRVLGQRATFYCPHCQS